MTHATQRVLDTRDPDLADTVLIPRITDRDAARRRIVVRQVLGWFAVGVLIGLALVVA